MLAQAACELVPHVHTLSWRRAACRWSQSLPLPRGRLSTTTTSTRSTAPSPSRGSSSHATYSSRASRQPSEGSNSGDDPTFVGIRDSLDLSQPTDVTLITTTSVRRADSDETELGPSNDVFVGSSRADSAAFWATSASGGGSSGVHPRSKRCTGPGWQGRAGRR